MVPRMEKELTWQWEEATQNRQGAPPGKLGRNRRTRMHYLCWPWPACQGTQIKTHQLRSMWQCRDDSSAAVLHVLVLVSLRETLRCHAVGCSFFLCQLWQGSLFPAFVSLSLQSLTRLIFNVEWPPKS